MAVITASLLLVGGCHGRSKVPPPELFPVTGVVTAPAGVSLENAHIQFEPDDLAFRSQAFLDAEGRFSLFLVFCEQKLPGAIAGAHRVTLLTPLKVGGGGERVDLREKLTVEPHENHFVIPLPEP